MTLRATTSWFLVLAVLFAFAAPAQQRPAMFHNPPAKVKAGDVLRVDGLLVNGKDLRKIIVRYRRPGGEYREAEMVLRYGELYRVELPPWELDPPAVEYFIEGQPRKGSRVVLFMSATSPVRVPVIGQPKPEAGAAAEADRKAEADRRAELERQAQEDRRAEAARVAEEDRRAAEEERRANTERIEAARRSESEKREADRKAAEVRAEEVRAEEARRSEAARRDADRREADRRDADRRQEDRREAARGDTESGAEAGPRTGADRDSDAGTRERTGAPSPPTASRPPPDGSSSRTTGWADDPPPRPRSELAEELSIYAAEDTGTSFSRHSTEVRETPITSSMLGRSELRAMGARSLVDVLNALPGVFVSRDVSGFYRIGVRGIRADPEVLVFVDGQRLNHFDDGRALVDLPVENITRVEVVRGPSTVREPEGALLAVVNVYTDRTEGFRGAASAGSFGSFTGHLAGASSMGDVQLFGDLDLVRHGGAVRPIRDDSLGAEMIDQGYRRDTARPVGSTRDDRWFVNASGGATWSSSSVGQLSGHLRFLGEHRNALIGLFDTVGAQSPLSWRALLGDVRYERALGPTIQLRATVRADEQSTSRTFQQSPGAGLYWDDNFTGTRTIAGYCTAQISFGDPCPDGRLFANGIMEQQRSSAFGVGGTVETDIALVPTNRLTVGLSADHRVLYERATLINYDPEDLTVTPGGAMTSWASTALENPDAARSRFAGAFYAQDVWTIIDPLTLTVGFRADLVSVPVVADTEVRLLRFSGTRLVPSLNPRVALAYAPWPSLVLTTRYGRAFRAPTPSELLPSTPDSAINGGRFTGNPTLEPATVDTVDLGADLVQSAGDARVRLRGNVFFSYFNNAIAAADVSGNVIPLSNRLGVRVIGAEAEARLDVTDRARAWVNASWFRAEDLEAREPVRLLTDTPQWQVNANISMPLGDWLNIDVMLQNGAERRNLARTPLENIRRWTLPAYTLIGVQLRSEKFLDRWEAVLSVQNAFAYELADDAFRMDRMPGGVPREGVGGHLLVRGAY